MANLKIDPSNPRTFDKMVAKGRGRGIGDAYKPWLTVRDLSSRGLSCRLPGWRCGRRSIHLFSKLERAFFYRLEWDETVTDIREQYPLDLVVTHALAEDRGWYHPISRKTGLPMPMTSDFLVTRAVDGVEKFAAYYVKPLQDIELLDSKRPQYVKNNLAKLRLEREYWKGRADHFLVTEADFNQVLSQNVHDVRLFYHLQSLSPLGAADVERVHNWLFDQVKLGTESLSHLALACDRKSGLPGGKSLKVARHLIATHRWPVDFSVPFEPSKILKLK